MPYVEERLTMATTLNSRLQHGLSWIAWETTLRCNFSCIHCRSSSNDDFVDTLPTAKAIQVLDKIGEFCKPVVVLSGGEPLLRPDIFDLASYGTEKGFRMCLATNGSLLDIDTCKSIKKSGIRLVSLSLDGPTADVHDGFRGYPGAFDSVLRAAALLKNESIEFIINSSFTQRNQAQIQATYALAKKLGAKAWYMFMIIPTGRGEDVKNELISQEDYDEILRWHYQLEQADTDMLLRPTCAPQYYRVYAQEAKKEGKSTKRRTLSFSTGGDKGCVAGQRIALIRHNGDVLPCSYFPVSGGNLFDSSLAKIWESKLFKDMRDFKAYKDRCGVCEYSPVCGGCRARAYAYTGDYMEQEPYCSYQPILTRQ